MPVAEAIVTTQRDHGDRTNRKHARLKYTIEDRGLPWFREEVEKRSGVAFAEPAAFSFAGNGDVYGWQRDDAGDWQGWEQFRCDDGESCAVGHQMASRQVLPWDKQGVRMEYQ